MNKFKKNHLYVGAASLALIGLSPAAWGMDYMFSSEDKKVVRALASNILPSIPNRDRIMTPSQGPAGGKVLMREVSELDGDFGQRKNTFQETISGKGQPFLVEKPCMWPNSVHGIVRSTFQSHDKSYTYLGAGTLIAPNLVLTSAQNLCITDTEKGPIGRATDIKFYPGIEEIEEKFITPFGEQNVKAFYFPEEYIKNSKENYGLLVLEEPVGETTGYFGISVLPPEEVCELELNVTGYSDKNKLWTMKSKPNRVTENSIDYPVETPWKQNGSGVWYKDDNENYFVTGVLNLGDEIASFDFDDDSNISTTYTDTATVLTKSRYEKIRTWVQDVFKDPHISKPEENLFSSVEFVNLQRNGIGNLGVNKLCNYAKYLRAINLSGNSIEDDGCESLGLLQHLIALDLSNNYIGDNGFKVFTHHSTLTSLNLSKNLITLNKDIVLHNFSKKLFNNSKLMLLNLSSNRIDHNGAMILAERLAENPSLTMLALSNNQISDAGKVLLALAHNAQLKILNFSNPYNISVTAKTLAGIGSTVETIGRIGAVLVTTAATASVVTTATNGAIVAVGLKAIGTTGGTAALTTLAGKAVLEGGIARVPELILGRSGAILTELISTTLGYNRGMEAARIVNNSLSNVRDEISSQFMKWEGKFVIGEEEVQALSQNTTLTGLNLSDTGLTGDIAAILESAPNIAFLLNWGGNDIQELYNRLSHLNIENNYIDGLINKNIIDAFIM